MGKVTDLKNKINDNILQYIEDNNVNIIVDDFNALGSRNAEIIKTLNFEDEEEFKENVAIIQISEDEFVVNEHFIMQFNSFICNLYVLCMIYTIKNNIGKYSYMDTDLEPIDMFLDLDFMDWVVDEFEKY